MVGIEGCGHAAKEKLSPGRDPDPFALANHQPIVLQPGELLLLENESAKRPRVTRPDRSEVHLEAAEQRHDERPPCQVLVAGSVTAHRGATALLEGPCPVVHVARV